MWQYVVIAFILVSQCQAFNVDVYEPIVRESLQTEGFDDKVNKDLFGFKVALYNSSTGPRYGLWL